jgi:CBS-domain-containing membrane protein
VETPHAIATPTHSIKTNAIRVKSVRTAKIDPATDPARKWNATTDIKAFPSSDHFRRLGGTVTDALNL